MKIYGGWFAAVLLASAWHALGPVTVVAAEDACEEAVTTAEMRECIDRRYAAVDQELNDVYKQLMAQLDPKRQELLKHAQRAWIDYRDKDAAFVASSVEGGTLYPVVEIAERVLITERRVAELKGRLP